MNNLSNFSPFFELIGAINFSLMAFHILSYNDKTFKGFHHILSQFTTPFFDRHIDTYNGLVSGEETSTTLDKKILNIRKWLERRQEQLKTTHGFTNSCLISGISSVIILLFDGLIKSNLTNNESPFFVSYLVLTILFLLFILGLDVFISDFKIFKTPFHMIMVYFGLTVTSYLFFKFCTDSTRNTILTTVCSYADIISLSIVSWSIVMYLGRYASIFCVVSLRNSIFKLRNGSGITHLKESNKHKEDKLDEVIGVE